MLCPVVKVLLGHYRRYPLQIVLVWLGLTLGVSFFIGVMAISNHVRQSYEHDEKLFANPLPYYIRSKTIGKPIPFSFYRQLKKAGFSQCIPFESFRTSTHQGLDIILIGIEPVGTRVDLAPFFNYPVFLSKTPHQVVISSDLARKERLKDGDWIRMKSGARLGPVIIDQNNWIFGSRIIVDLSLVQGLKGTKTLSAIACGDMRYAQLKRLKQHLPGYLTINRNYRSDIGSLTKAFLLNLKVIAMLAFLVGLFIYYQAISLSFIQRQPLVGLLRQMGVSGKELITVLAIELGGLILLSWVSGNLLGLFLANLFIPAVDKNLMPDSTHISFLTSWHWQWGVYSILLIFFGACAACLWPLIRLLKSPPIRLTMKVSLIRFAGIEFAFQGGLALLFLGVAVSLYFGVSAPWTGFAVPALILISVGLATPYVIWKVFDFLSYRLKNVRRRWFFADAAASMGYRGIATMAFLIALTANIGVETLVGSFRGTMDSWLNERLSADVYIYASPSSENDISQWLKLQSGVTSVWKRWERDIASRQGLLQVISSGDSEDELRSLTVKVAVPEFWQRLHHSKSILVSESMALKLGIRPGDIINLPKPLGKRWQVVGVYYDYGNPFYQLLISEQRWLSYFGHHGDIVLSAITEKGYSLQRLRRDLELKFNLDADRIFDNRAIHHMVMNMFDRTFSVANKFGKITLLIAIFGIFFATLAGEMIRQRHQTLLRCLGVSGKELVMISCAQLCIFAFISLVIAIPLGITLASLVLDIVIKQMFGWSVQLHFSLPGYIEMSFWSLVALILAGVIPILKLILRPAVKSLRDAL
jgi:putative ABC transport system permease protein